MDLRLSQDERECTDEPFLQQSRSNDTKNIMSNGNEDIAGAKCVLDDAQSVLKPRQNVEQDQCHAKDEDTKENLMVSPHANVLEAQIISDDCDKNSGCVRNCKDNRTSSHSGINELDVEVELNGQETSELDDKASKKKSNSKKAFSWDLFKEPSFLLILFVTFMGVFSFGVNLTFLPAMAADKGGSSP